MVDKKGTTDYKSGKSNYRRKLLKEISSTFSHQLNNILTPVAINSELITMEREYQSNEKIKLYIDQITEAVEIGKKFMDEIKGLADVDNEMLFQIVDIGDLIQEILVKLYQFYSDALLIRIIRNVEHAKIFGHKESLYDVFYAILENTLYSLSGKDMRCQVMFETVEGSLKVALTVLIRDDQFMKSRDETFPFFAKSHHRHKKISYTLPIVTGIVNAHEGDLCFDCPEDSDKYLRCCNIQLPLFKIVSDRKPLESTQHSMKKTRILLIEDEPSVLKTEENILTELGYEVHPQFDSERAFQFFVKNIEHLDVVIVDLDLGNSTGLELARKIHTIKKDLPIILCTGSMFKSSKKELHDAGIRDKIIKPFSGRQIHRKITHLLDEGENTNG